MRTIVKYSVWLISLSSLLKMLWHDLRLTTTQKTHLVKKLWHINSENNSTLEGRHSKNVPNLLDSCQILKKDATVSKEFSLNIFSRKNSVIGINGELLLQFQEHTHLEWLIRKIPVTMGIGALLRIKASLTMVTTNRC